MSTKKTVLILGAGASRSYGFPTAAELTDMILGRLPPRFISDHRFNKGVEPGPNWNDWILNESSVLDPAFVRSFQQHFEAADTFSIDRFLAFQPKHEAIAKPIIARILLLCEGKSTLRGGWYAQFWNDVIQDAIKTESPPIDVITFNYDRSLEQYLQTVSAAAYADSNKALAAVRIQHVYGSLGSLDGDGNVTEYGEVQRHKKASTGIKLISPRAACNSTIRDTILSCDRAVFLGFGFDSLNLDTLGRTSQNHPREMFASCYGLSTRLKAQAEDRLPGVIWVNETVDDMLRKSMALH